MRVTNQSSLCVPRTRLPNVLFYLPLRGSVIPQILFRGDNLTIIEQRSFRIQIRAKAIKLETPRNGLLLPRMGRNNGLGDKFKINESQQRGRKRVRVRTWSIKTTTHHHWSSGGSQRWSRRFECKELDFSCRAKTQ